MKKFFTFILMGLVLSVISCTKDNPEGPDKPSKEIIGAWDGVSLTGEAKCAYADSRMVFYADSTFIHYAKYGDVWYYAPNFEKGYYSVEGKNLTLRWTENEEQTDFFTETWTITGVGNGKMTWHSPQLLPNDSTVTWATFEWKKSSKPTDEHIKKTLVGTWRPVSSLLRYIGEDRQIDSVEVLDIWAPTDFRYTYRADSTMQIYEKFFADPEDPESEDEVTINQAIYWLEHDILNFTWEEEGEEKAGFQIIYDINDTLLTTIIRMIMSEDGRAVLTTQWERLPDTPSASSVTKATPTNKKRAAKDFRPFIMMKRE